MPLLHDYTALERDVCFLLVEHGDPSGHDLGYGSIANGSGNGCRRSMIVLFAGTEVSGHFVHFPEVYTLFVNMRNHDLSVESARCAPKY